MYADQKFTPQRLGLIVICGPTATGKTSLAIALAQRFGGEIISADSRLVYRDFDIGTAKPTAAERSLVPHHLIDICNPTENFTVANYQTQVQALLSSGPSPAWLVGGTGLYIKSITRGLKMPRVPPHLTLRSQLAQLGQAHCHALLKQVDPTTPIHPNDAVRTVRSLEVYYATGVPLTQQQGEHPPTYPILQIGLDCLTDWHQAPSTPQQHAKNVAEGPWMQLDQRISQRVQGMVEQGFGVEVEQLVRRYGPDLPLLQTLGYAEFAEYLRGEQDLAGAIAATVLHTRQFAKRQRTWFRAVQEIEWFDAQSPHLEQIVGDRIAQFWQQVLAGSKD
jgi:tRNA dimethylallyltransferase